MFEREAPALSPFALCSPSPSQSKCADVALFQSGEAQRLQWALDDGPRCLLMGLDSQK